LPGVHNTTCTVPWHGHQKAVGASSAKDLAFGVRELADVSLVVLSRQDEEHLGVSSSVSAHACHHDDLVVVAVFRVVVQKRSDAELEKNKKYNLLDIDDTRYLTNEEYGTSMVLYI
jgi:hypothetical protein